MVDTNVSNRQPVWRLTAFVLCAGLLAAPFLCVTFPPITDLPWQAGQMRLFHEAATDPSSPYEIHWFGPNRLAYAFLGLAWGVAGPERAARVTMILVALAWVGGLHWLSRRRRRPVAATVLAGVFFFNHFLYRGYLNFAIGVPVFLVWAGAMADAPPGNRRAAWSFAGALVGAVFLFLAHVLWLAVGTLWLVANSIARRHPLRVVAVRCAGILPLAVAAAAWYRTLPGQWSVAASYQSSLLTSTSPGLLVNYALGGVRGWLEPAVLLVVVVWASVALWQQRGTALPSLDRPLLGAAVLLAVLAVALPVSAGTTLDLASRWLPVACTLLVLSLPPLHVPGVSMKAAAVGLLAACCVTTALVWRVFERDEMAGFRGCIDAIPAGATVLGLDYARTSPRFKTWPFYLMHGYATVFRDARPNISRVTHPSSLVLHEGTFAPWPWTGQLPWHPERVKASDFDHFDYVLLHAHQEKRAGMALEFGLTPLTPDGDWRLYRIERDR